MVFEKNQDNLTEADRWRQRFGIRPEWHEIPRWEAFTIRDNIDTRIEDHFTAKMNDIENNNMGSATTAISKEITLKQENDDLKARLNVNEEKFIALEKEWKKTLETLAAKSPRKSPRKSPSKKALLNNNSFKVLTPERNRYTEGESEQKKIELEQATTGWLRWLRECIDVKATQVQNSKNNSATNVQRMNRFQELAKFDASSVSDASSFDGRYRSNNHTFDVEHDERASSPPPPLPPALQESAIGPEAHSAGTSMCIINGSCSSKRDLEKEALSNNDAKIQKCNSKSKGGNGRTV